MLGMGEMISVSYLARHRPRFGCTTLSRWRTLAYHPNESQYNRNTFCRMQQHDSELYKECAIFDSDACRSNHVDADDKASLGYPIFSPVRRNVSMPIYLEH